MSGIHQAIGAVELQAAIAVLDGATAVEIAAAEQIAPNAEVYLVSNDDPDEFAATCRAALEYPRARDRRLA